MDRLVSVKWLPRAGWKAVNPKQIPSCWAGFTTNVCVCGGGTIQSVTSPPNQSARDPNLRPRSDAGRENGRAGCTTPTGHPKTLPGLVGTSSPPGGKEKGRENTCSAGEDPTSLGTSSTCTVQPRGAREHPGPPAPPKCPYLRALTGPLHELAKPGRSRVRSPRELTF